MVHILIVQHGEKARTPHDPDLTVLGRQQAQAVARHISDRYPVTAIVCSPYRRTRETATSLASMTGVQLRFDDRLRERMNWEPESTGQTLDQFLSEWNLASQDRNLIPTSGDSSHQAAQRFREALLDHANSMHEGETLVVVAHGGITVDLLRSLLGDEEVRLRAPELIENGVPSCAVTSLVLEGEEISVRQIAETDHLEPHLGTAHTVL